MTCGAETREAVTRDPWAWEAETVARACNLCGVALRRYGGALGAGSKAVGCWQDGLP